ncbi:MAG: prepilin peptidase [Lachnoclostridium sp.]|jgi:prepilin peptidase CpaA|nr:prepilin peptidase [Lachnoclostridium sp.]
MIDSTLLFFVLLPASISDLYYYKVPNTLLAYGLFLSFLLRVVGNRENFFPWLVGGLIPFLLCFILYLLGAIGASDVKLFSVIGSFYPYKTGIQIILVSMFIGAFFSVIQIIRMKDFRRRWYVLQNYLIRMIIEKKRIPYEKEKASVLPFAVCIFFASLIVIAIKRWQGVID